ncbi:MAG: PQQ-dependent sugar dehydrogenase [Candidatus Bipolaricaulia bacterium]
MHDKNNASATLVILGVMFLALLVGSSVTYAQQETATVKLNLVAKGFTSPVGLASPNDGSDRLFVVDQIGVIKVINPRGKVVKEPFLDLQEKIVNLDKGYDERGLLGMAFHPNYEENGRFFVYYSAPSPGETSGPSNHISQISEFTVSDKNPNKADPNSEKVLLQVNQPQLNHNGGQISFGPEGFLYIGLGDGGAANDVGPGHPPLGNGQDITTLKGSILRIDVDKDDPYGVPSDNPFVGTEGRDEIFAYGFRNPWRFSFDSRGDHRLFVADVGQNLYEEVDIVRKGGNYGWNIKEGIHCFNPKDPTNPPKECSNTGPQGRPLEDPILEYAHPGTETNTRKVGVSIVGGFIYRGEDIAGLQGKYLFGDWSTSFGEANGTVMVASPPKQAGELWSIRELRIANTDNGHLNQYLLAFGRDGEGEIYALTTENAGPSGNTGKVYKLTSSSPSTEGTSPTVKEDEMNEEVTIAIEGGEWYFEPETITVQKGQKVTLEFKNTGSYSHNLKIGEFDVMSTTISGNGKTTSITFTVDKVGKFPFWCAIPGHRSRGMEGTLIVEE